MTIETFFRQKLRIYLHFSKDTRIQGYKDTRIQGHKDTRIQGYKDTWIHGYKDARIQGYKDTRIQVYKDTRIQGYKDTRIQEYKYARIQGYKDVRGEEEQGQLNAYGNIQCIFSRLFCIFPPNYSEFIFEYSYFFSSIWGWNDGWMNED